MPLLLHHAFIARHARAAFGCFVVLLSLGGCATVDRYVPTARTFGVYKLDINQGNYVTQDQVEKLKAGMTRQQVRTILGTPLVTDAFHDNRWDYIYEFTRQGKRLEHRRFTVFFNEDKLARWEGDEMPESAIVANRAAAEKSMRQPRNDDESMIGRWWRGIFGR